MGEESWKHSTNLAVCRWRAAPMLNIPNILSFTSIAPKAPKISNLDQPKRAALAPNTRNQADLSLNLEIIAMISFTEHKQRPSAVQAGNSLKYFVSFT